MKHSVDELSEIVHHYYTRGMPNEDPRNKQTEEYRRLSAARRQAGANREPWRELLRRIDNQFPECSQTDNSLHLPTGSYDAGYCGELILPVAPGEHGHGVGFLISFLVPYYIIYSARTVEIAETNPLPDVAKVLTFYRGNKMYILPDRWWTRLLARAAEALSRIGELRPGAPVDPDRGRDRERKKISVLRRDISFDFLPEEQPYAAWLAQEIETTWGCERMPPEVGNVIVPDIATNNRPIGEARLYDCLFSDNW